MSDQPNTEIESTQDIRLWATLSYISPPLCQSCCFCWRRKRSRPFIKAHLAQALVFGTLVGGDYHPAAGLNRKNRKVGSFCAGHHLGRGRQPRQEHVKIPFI